MSDASRLDIVLTSDRFNLSEPKEYYINDCCYGDDLSQWLVERLRSRGFTVTEPDQEDWGWYFDVRVANGSYFVGVGGTPDEESSVSNQGQWRLMVQKHRTVWQKLTGANQLSQSDLFCKLLQEIVADEPGMKLIGVE